MLETGACSVKIFTPIGKLKGRNVCISLPTQFTATHVHTCNQMWKTNKHSQQSVSAEWLFDSFLPYGLTLWMPVDQWGKDE